jgi:hypothetical protein
VTSALVLAADIGEYPSLNRAGIRALARGALPLLGLGVINLVALDAPPKRWRTVVTWLAVAGNVLLLVRVVRRLAAGAPPITWMEAPPLVWILAGTGSLLLVGSIGCVVARPSAPRG